MTEPLAFRHGTGATAFQTALACWVVFEGVMRVRQRLLAGRHRVRDPSGAVLYVCIVGSVGAALALGRYGPLVWPGGPVWPLAAGLGLMAAGVAVRAWSIATLGRFFQYRIEIQPDHRVVSDGPYRWVRHPSYSGIALVFGGVALASGDVLSLAAVTALAGAGMVVRIRAEERQLRQALGADYERFAAPRKRLLPGIW